MQREQLLQQQLLGHTNRSGSEETNGFECAWVLLKSCRFWGGGGALVRIQAGL